MQFMVKPEHFLFKSTGMVFSVYFSVLKQNKRLKK